MHRYDTGKDKFIDFEELKHMMEKLGVPQTHLCLKEMIKEVDEDFDGKISFREVWTDYIYIMASVSVEMYYYSDVMTCLNTCDNHVTVIWLQTHWVAKPFGWALIHRLVRTFGLAWTKPFGSVRSSD